MKDKRVFLKWATPGLFFFNFVFPIQLIVNEICRCESQKVYPIKCAALFKNSKQPCFVSECLALFIIHDQLLKRTLPANAYFQSNAPELPPPLPFFRPFLPPNLIFSVGTFPFFADPVSAALPLAPFLAEDLLALSTTFPPSFHKLRFALNEF